jgi:hypothetical protein
MNDEQIGLLYADGVLKKDPELSQP